MAQGSSFSDKKICKHCLAEKKSDGACPNQCQELFGEQRDEPASQSEDLKAETEANYEQSQTLPNQTAISVEGSRANLCGVHDHSDGRQKAEMAETEANNEQSQTLPDQPAISVEGSRAVLRGVHDHSDGRQKAEMAETEANNEQSQTLPDQPAISVEGSRAVLREVHDHSDGRQKTEMAETEANNDCSEFSTTCVTSSSPTFRRCPVPAEGSHYGNPKTADEVRPRPAQTTVSHQQGLPESPAPQVNRGLRGPRWRPAIDQVQQGTSDVLRRRKRLQRGPRGCSGGGVIVIPLSMQLCVKNNVMTPLPLDEHNKLAFIRLCAINKFKKGSFMNGKFFFYEVNYNHIIIRQVVKIFQHQLKDICFRMFKGEVIENKEIVTEDDILIVFELIGFHITDSQVTGKLPSMIWRCEF